MSTIKQPLLTLKAVSKSALALGVILSLTISQPAPAKAQSATRPTGVLTFSDGISFYDYNLATRELTDYGQGVNPYRAKSGDTLVKINNPDHDLVLVSPDGKMRRTITKLGFTNGSSNESFLLSPDGKTVVYDSQSNLVVHNVQTGEDGSSLPMPGFDWPVPQDWTPDGKLIISQNGEQKSINFAFIGKDFASGQSVACQAVSIDQPGTKPVDWISDLRIDPSGKRVAFVWGSDIWVCSWDGYGAKQITESNLSDVGATGEDEPAWSPDGHWLAVRHYAGALSEIYLVPVDGKIHSTDDDDKAVLDDKTVIKVLDKKGSVLFSASDNRITWGKAH